MQHLTQTRLSNALVTDRVLSEGQLKRYFGLELSQVQKYFYSTTAFLAQRHHSQEINEYRFIVLDRKAFSLKAAQLRHLAGISEMRHYLNVPANNWKNSGNAVDALLKPDGVWFDRDRIVYLEYDAGSYSGQQVEAKLKMFSIHEKVTQCWGTVTEGRMNFIQSHVDRLGLKSRVEIFVAPWW